MQLPKYKCHKEVNAAKIQRIERAPGSDYDVFMSVVADGDAVERVTHDWLVKFQPQVGGYVVVYEDGYRSYSPADVFEAGYAKVEDVPVAVVKKSAAK